MTQTPPIGTLNNPMPDHEHARRLAATGKVVEQLAGVGVADIVADADSLRWWSISRATQCLAASAMRRGDVDLDVGDNAVAVAVDLDRLADTASAEQDGFIHGALFMTLGPSEESDAADEPNEGPLGDVTAALVRRFVAECHRAGFSDAVILEFVERTAPPGAVEMLREIVTARDE